MEGHQLQYLNAAARPPPLRCFGVLSRAGTSHSDPSNQSPGGCLVPAGSQRGTVLPVHQCGLLPIHTCDCDPSGESRGVGGVDPETRAEDGPVPKGRLARRGALYCQRYEAATSAVYSRL